MGAKPETKQEVRSWRNTVSVWEEVMQRKGEPWSLGG